MKNGKLLYFVWIVVIGIVLVILNLNGESTKFYGIADTREIVINAETIFSQARERVSGIGTPDLHLIEIRDFRVSLPPVKEQHEIVRRVEAFFKLTDVIEKRVTEAKAQTDNLYQAILVKAFRGELVPTEAEQARREGRSYEPASALLDKIRAQRKNVKPQRKLGRTLQRKDNISDLTS